MKNKEERVKQMNKLWNYCPICSKRCGSWFYDCAPSKVWGRHGSGKPIYSHKYREYKSWKHNRKTQWK
jgi:hypothetical protein